MQAVSFKEFIEFELPFANLSNQEISDILETTESMVKHQDHLEMTDPALFELTRNVKQSLVNMNKDLWAEIARRN